MIRKKIATLLAALIVFGNVLLPVPVYAADQNDFEVNPFAQADLFRRQRQSGMLANRDAFNGQTDGELKTAEAKTSAGEKKKAIAAGQSYLVQFNGGSSLQAIENVLQGEDYQLIGSSENRLFQLTTSDIGAFRKKAAGLLEYLEKDQSRQAKQVANDYFYDEQWALPMVNAPAAWDISTGSSGADTVYVAVIDSGVDRSHPDLDNANIQSGWDYIGASACAGDYFGHGTSVTGIIAAETNNGEGMAGVCWNVAIVPLQIVDRSGYIALSDMISAIYDAVDAGCKVINLSMGRRIFRRRGRSDPVCNRQRLHCCCFRREFLRFRL